MKRLPCGVALDLAYRETGTPADRMLGDWGDIGRVRALGAAVVVRLALPILGAALSVAYIIFASGCGPGQIGPETLILAETPCGRIKYQSTKDQTAPGAVCRIGPDGAAYLEMGADASSGSGAVARAVAEGIVKGIGAAR